jgi:hypothetical protein
MDDPNQKSGFHFAYGPTGAPYTEWWNWMTVAGNSWQSSNNYEFQLAHDFHSDGFYVRRMTNGVVATWRKILDSNNYSGYSTFTGNVHGAVYYDSNNTNFYIDPSSGGTAANLAGKIEIQGGSNSTTAGLQITSNYGAPYIATYYGNMHTSNDLYIGPVASSGNNLYANNSYANIFYDKNSTSYYFDGSSTGDSIRVAGDIVAYYSDERLKDNKGNIKNALEKVLSLNGFYYEPNNKAQELGYKKRLEVGVSAQEVEAILPEIIKDAPIGQGYKTLDYGKLTPLLIEAIKEQQEQIQEQQKQIDELKELVNKLITK